jgi:Methyltransferase domain
VKLNVGAGRFPIHDWTNLDADPAVKPDIVATVPPLPYADESLEEIYAGHFLEHLDVDVAHDFLVECRRCLIPGGKLGILVPDTRAIMQHYLDGDARVEYPLGTWRDIGDLDEVCRLFLYSTVQESPHLWSYDLASLRQRLEWAGFTVGQQIDRWRDPRLGSGQWYQCGWDAVKPGGAQ